MNEHNQGNSPMTNAEVNDPARREEQLANAFVELADSLVDEFDVIDFLHTLAERAVELLHADAAGIMMADQRGQLQLLASTAEQAQLLEIFELQNSEGPCLDCFNSGHAVVNVDLDDAEVRWPRFKQVATHAGYRSVHAIPLRLRDQIIGAMNLFCIEHSTLSDNDITIARGLCNIATIGLLQERAIRQGEVLTEQLQGALNSRVLIEQAKGVLAERTGLDIDDAFSVMRAYARSQRRPLSAVAADVINGSFDPAEIRPSL